MSDDYANYLETQLRAGAAPRPVRRLAVLAAVLAVVALALLGACGSAHGTVPLHAGDCAVRSGAGWDRCRGDGAATGGRYTVVYVAYASSLADSRRATCGTGLERYDSPGALRFICLRSEVGAR